MTISRLCLALFSTLLLAGFAIAAPDYDETVKLGREALKARDAKTGMKYAQEAIEQKPEEFESLRLFARALAAQGDFKQALEFIEKALVLQPDDVESLRTQSLCYFEIGEVEKAHQLLQKAIEKYPGESSLYYNRAYYQMSKENLDLPSARAAVSDLTQAIVLDPNDPESFTNRAWLYIAMGQYPDAITDLNRAIELNPDRGQSYVSLALLYIDTGNKAKATQTLEECLKLQGEANEEWVERAQTLLDQLKDEKEAESSRSEPT